MYKSCVVFALLPVQCAVPVSSVLCLYYCQVWLMAGMSGEIKSIHSCLQLDKFQMMPSLTHVAIGSTDKSQHRPFYLILIVKYKTFSLQLVPSLF